MKILDVCCGSRMFWYDKHEPHTTYCDIRQEKKDLPSGHHINVNPDVVADFRSLPFADCTFDNVIFDPPHLLHAGPKSWLRAKYGVLNTKTWKDDLKQEYLGKSLGISKPFTRIIASMQKITTFTTVQIACQYTLRF